MGPEPLYIDKLALDMMRCPNNGDHRFSKGTVLPVLEEYVSAHPESDREFANWYGTDGYVKSGDRAEFEEEQRSFARAYQEFIGFFAEIPEDTGRPQDFMREFADLACQSFEYVQFLVTLSQDLESYTSLLNEFPINQYLSVFSLEPKPI